MAIETLTQQISSIDPQIGAMIADKPWLIALIVIAMIWKLVWYGIALYQSGSRKQKPWFVVLFICSILLNDLGLLPILYLTFNREKSKIKPSKKKR
jgi:RsiW-degrading membrane proteinase PrsW (M82 family)